MNERVTGPGVDRHDALEVLRQVRSEPRHVFLDDATSLADTQLDLATLAGHRQVMDFHLLNVAASHDATLATFDRAIPSYVAPEGSRSVVLVPVD